MAKYKRQKVKHYHRSFLTAGKMRVKRGIGIAVLVVAVLAAAMVCRTPMCWIGPPTHGIPWSRTGTSRPKALPAPRQPPLLRRQSSAAASQAASEPEPEEEKPLDGKAITGGSWAELDVTALTDDAAIRAAARQLKQQGADYALVTLKDAAGTVYYASGVANAAQSITENPVDAANIAAILREEGHHPGGTACRLYRPGVGVHRPQHGRALRWQQPLAGQRQRSQGRQGMDEPLCRKRGAVCRRPH